MPVLSRCRDIVASLLLTYPCLHAQALEPTFTEDRYPGGVAELGQPGERWICVRVIDRLRGTPIPHAELLLIAESNAPVGGEPIDAWCDQADADGFLAMRVDEGADGYVPWNWLCIRAPGYCQHMCMRALDDDVVQLSPAVTVPVQIRDWRNLPVAGALVGFCSGCGHTPDLVHGVTQHDGICMMPGVDLLQGIADFYVVHPDLELGYESPGWFPGKQPMVIRLGPGLAHRGVVVDHAGMPVAGAAVGQSTVHRGPWALTRPDGSYEVCGLDSPTDLMVQHQGRKVIFGAPATHGARLQLPQADGNQTMVVEQPDAEARRATLRFEQLELMRVQREAEWPTVLVRTVGFPADGCVRLRTAHGTRDLNDWIVTGRPVPLPDEEFVFELEAEDSLRVIPGNREQAVQDGVVRLRWFQPTMVEGRIVDASGAVIKADVAIEPLFGATADSKVLVAAASQGALQLAVASEGLFMLTLRHRYSGAERRVPIELPPRGDDVVVDVGTLVIAERSPLTVLKPDGSPFEQGSIQLLRRGFYPWQLQVDDQQQLWGPDLRAGDCLLVASELLPPSDLDGAALVDVSSRFLIEGTGPWSCQQHAGELLLDIDADGAKVGVTIGEHFFIVEKPTLVRGLATGDCQLFGSAVGRQSVVVTVVVPEPGQPRVRVSLRLPPL
jgi:hypothetical protein